MNWRKTGLILAAVFVVIGIALIVAVKSIDVNRFKPDITNAVRNATGRELTLGGDLDLKIGLHPALVVENVGFENASWGSRPELATIGRLEIEVSLLPLLQRKVEVIRFALVDADILVETDPSGTSNLHFDTPESPPSDSPDAASAAPAPDLAVQEIEIQNGRITYRDGQTDTSQTVVIASLLWSPAAVADQVELLVSGDYNEHTFEIAGTAGRPGLLLDPKQTWPMDLVVKMAEWSLSAAGSLKDIRSISGVDVAVQVEATAGAVPSLGRIVNLASPLPDIGPLHFSGRIRDPEPGLLRIEEIELKAQPAASVLTVQGAIGDVLARKDAHFEFHLAAPSLPKLGTMLGAGDLPDIGPITVEAALTVPDTATIQVADLKAAFSESDLNGTATLALSGKRPKLTAALASRKLDLRPFSSPESKETAGAAPPDRDRIFSSAPLPLEGLRKVDADIQLRLASILMKNAALTDASAAIRIDSGKLRVSPIQATAGGAKVTAAIEVDASEKIPRFSKKVQVQQLNLGKMLAGAGIRQAADGTGDLNADLTSRGRSVAELMGGMNGRIVFALQNGFVKQHYIDLLSFDFATGIYQQLFSLLGAPADGQAEIQCLFANLDIRNGIVDVSPLVMKTPRTTVFGTGDINLKTERLNLSVSSEPTRGTAVIRFGLGQLAKMFKLTGTLAKPSLGIDPVESAVILSKMFGGTTLTGTTMAVKSLLGSRELKDNPCLQMTEAADTGAATGKEGGQPPAPLKDAVMDAGKSILNIFKKD